MSPRTTLPRATDALVAPDDPPDTLARIAREKHTLLERHAFERVGTTTSLASSRGRAQTHNESSSSSDGASSFAVRPSVMHFGGFEPGKTHTQTFVVTNAGAKSRRLVVIEPTTEHFRVLPRRARDAKRHGGKLAPGVSEAITVAFTPKDGVRYYYDCVRVHAEGAPGLVLPVHAYPVMNEVAFPRVIDFGLRATGETHEKTVTMTCTAPIAFEYELIPSKETCFSVTPASGIVPAEGRASIAVAFSPSVAATSTLELEVRVAQFGFRPFVCQVRGTGFPANKNAVEKKHAREKEKPNPQVNPAPRPAPPAKPRPGLPSRRKRSGGDFSDAEKTHSFRADAAVAAFELRAAGYAKADAEAIVKHSELGPRGRKLSARAVLDAPRDVSSPETADGEETDGFDTKKNGYVSDASEDLVDGVFVPRKLRGASDFARVLSQKQGKLRAKDIEKAMAARDARVSAAATLRKSVATAAGAIAKMKASAAAAAFRKLLSAAGAARAKETAEDPTAEDPHREAREEEEEAARDGERPRLEEEDAREVGGVAALRGLFAAATFRSRSEDETMAALDDPELEPEVKAHLFEREFDRVRRFEKRKEWTECVAVGEAKRTAEEEKALTRRRRAREASLRYVEASAAMARLAAGEPAAFGARYDVSSSSHVTRASERENENENENENAQTFEPTFNPLSADDWPKRREALDRFAQAGRRVIVRNRAEKRLRGVRRLLRAAGPGGSLPGSLDGAAAFVARDVMTFTDGREGHAEVLEQTLDPKRRAFFRTRAEETREARLGVARTDALAEPPGSFESRKRPPLFPVFRASAFARRSAIGDAEMARSAIQPWEEIRAMKPIAPPTWRARGYGWSRDASERSAEGAFPALEGDGAPPPDSALPSLSAGAQEEEHTGVGVPARLAMDDVSSNDRAASPRRRLRAATAVAETVAPDAKRAWDPSLHPARFPPWSASFATPGPASRDRDASLLPATYGHEDSLASEPAGMNAAERSLSLTISTGEGANETRRSLFVAERFAPRENTNQTSLAAVDEWMAEWMAGPDPRDTAEAEGEGETPAAAPAPTLASVAEEVAKALGSGRAGDAGTGTGTGTRPEIGVVPGGVAARALVEREVDAAVASSRAERMRRVEARAAEIDAAVDDPRLRWRLEG